jgi:tetratricopeptide (TPR) repeat protein
MKVRFSVWLLGLIALSLTLQALLIQQAWAENPFALVPLGDSQVYWEWAGEIAAGNFIAEEPFQSAPAYPYFLALLRALGLDLLGVYGVQALLGALSLMLIADATRRRAGPIAGLLAGALWLFLDEAAFIPGRIWNLPLQLFSGSLLLWYATRIPQFYGLRTMLGLGLIAGFAVLCNPALLPAVILVAVWAGIAPVERNILGSVAALVVVALCIAPVTWHNRQASDETILISAQAGLTFAHGNSAAATGTYTPVPGVSENRRLQNRDALRIVEEATGERSWGATDSYFFARGRAWILDHPGDAFILEVRKFWWLMTGRYYADLYNPQLEKRTDFGSRLMLAPLTLALLLPLSILGIILVWRRESLRKRAPEILLLLGPAAIVMLFWYSPRYRLPLAPAAILLCAEVLVGAARAWRQTPSNRLPAAWALGLLAFAFVAGQVNRLTRFDAPHVLMPAFLHSVGDTLRVQEGREAEAIPYLEKAIQRGFLEVESHYSLALAYMKIAEQTLNDSGESPQERALPIYDQAVEQLRETVRLDPSQFEALFNLASIEFWFYQLARSSSIDVIPRVQKALDLAWKTGREGPAAQLQQMLSQLETP